MLSVVEPIPLQAATHADLCGCVTIVLTENECKRIGNLRHRGMAADAICYIESIFDKKDRPRSYQADCEFGCRGGIKKSITHRENTHDFTQT